MSRYDDDLIVQLKKEGKTWKEIGDVFGVKGERVRAYSRNRTWYKEIRDPKHMNIDLIGDKNPKLETFHSKTTLSDGSISSSIRERLLEKKQFTEKELLELHGFSSEEFKIKTVTSNEWSMTNSEGEKYYNFQSKIIAELRKLEDFSLERIAEIAEKIKPRPTVIKHDPNRKLEIMIGLYDMHFGLNAYKDYEPLLNDLCDCLNKGHDETLIIVGGDFFHVENKLMTTEKGTRVEDVDFEPMIEDGERFLIDLIYTALRTSNKVKLTYLPGNHAPTTDYTVVRTIAKLYPEVEADIKIDNFKHTKLGNHSIFSHHGDKILRPEKLLQVMVSKFAKEWGEAKSRYFITGHKHHETSLSVAGMTHYGVMSPSKSTQYEKDNGWITSETGLQVFEFDEVKRRAIYYL